MWLQGIRFYKVQDLHVRPQSLVVLSGCLKSTALASSLLSFPSYLASEKLELADLLAQPSPRP